MMVRTLIFACLWVSGTCDNTDVVQTRLQSEKALCPTTAKGCVQYQQYTLSGSSDGGYVDDATVRTAQGCANYCAAKQGCGAYFVHPEYGCVAYKAGSTAQCTGDYGWDGREMTCPESQEQAPPLCPTTAKGCVEYQQYTLSGSSDGGYVDDANVRSVEGCRDYCAARQGCGAYFVHPAYGCVMYKAGSTAMCNGDYGWDGRELMCQDQAPPLCPTTAKGCVQYQQYTLSGSSDGGYVDDASVRTAQGCRDYCAARQGCGAFFVHPDYGCVMYKAGSTQMCSGDYGWDGRELTC